MAPNVNSEHHQRQKAQYEFEMASLVVPDADAVAEAGRLVQDLPMLWEKADLGEKRKLLLTVLDAVGACPEPVEGWIREARQQP